MQVNVIQELKHKCDDYIYVTDRLYRQNSMVVVKVMVL